MGITLQRGVIFLFIIFLFGCYTEKKFEKQLGKGIIYYKGTFAKKAAELFPCSDVTGSDTIYIPADSSLYLNTISELNNELIAALGIQDSLISAIHIDTNCSKYEVVINELRKRNTQLQLQVAHIKPITNTIIIKDTVPDKAAIYACEQKEGKAVELALRNLNEANKFKGRSRKNFWIAVGEGAVLLLIGGFWVRRKVSKV